MFDMMVTLLLSSPPAALVRCLGLLTSPQYQRGLLLALPVQAKPKQVLLLKSDAFYSKKLTVI